jgi:hypothetical protein
MAIKTPTKIKQDFHIAFGVYQKDIKYLLAFMLVGCFVFPFIYNQPLQIIWGIFDISVSIWLVLPSRTQKKLKNWQAIFLQIKLKTVLYQPEKIEYELLEKKEKQL